jgi:hypothetical protein
MQPTPGNMSPNGYGFPSLCHSAAPKSLRLHPNSPRFRDKGAKPCNEYTGVQLGCARRFPRDRIRTVRGRDVMANSLPKTLPGVVRPQMVRCGKQGCKCARGALHGPYFYRFWREAGRLRKQYVPPDDLPEVRAACEQRQLERRLLTAGLQVASTMNGRLRSLDEASYEQSDSRPATML